MLFHMKPNQDRAHHARKQALYSMIANLKLEKKIKIFSFVGAGLVELYVRDFDEETVRGVLTQVGFDFKDPEQIRRHHSGRCKISDSAIRTKLATRLGFLLNRYQGKRLHQCILSGLTLEEQDACWKKALSFKTASKNKETTHANMEIPSMG